MMNKRTALEIVLGLALLASAPAAWAGLAEGYTIRSVDLPINLVNGQFTAHQGKIHYWAGSDDWLIDLFDNQVPGYQAYGYHVYDVASGVDTGYGRPHVNMNPYGFGDAFGVLDPVGQKFYVATTYGSAMSPNSDVYVYDVQSGSWLTPGPGGMSMVNGYGKSAYGGQAHNGRLYISGLGNDNNTYIYAFDSSGPTALIQASGNSTYLAVAPNGDVYYGTYDTETLYRWSAADVALAENESRLLTITDAIVVCTLPAGCGGVAVDDGGNVFFTTGYVLGMVDASASAGYRVIYSSDNLYDWFGAISVDGDFLKGGTLYFSNFDDNTWSGALFAITGPAIPEPTTMALLILAGLAAVKRRRR